MPQTPNKSYEVQVTGSNPGLWGANLNNLCFTILDNNLGGIVTKSLTNVNVTLSSTEAQNLIVRLTGTLTGAVQVTSAFNGIQIVENLTTGAFAVTFTNGVGTPLTLPQGARSVVIADATNGARIADNSFESGTKTLFGNATAPIGWTIDSSQTNAAIRIVSSGGGATGGSVDFSSVFASQTPSGTLSNTTVTATVPRDGWGDNGVGFGANQQARLVVASGQTENTEFLNSIHCANFDNVITATPHAHTFTGNAMNFSVKYRDMLLCVKS